MEITDLDRTERLLALMLLNQMKGASQREKIIQLNLAGFTNVEIADILQAKTAVVAQELYATKKTKGQRARKKSAPHKEPA
jgi:DNA-directed RNA polymerase specialized sigma24 family protein